MKMEKEPASTTLCFFKKLNNEQSPPPKFCHSTSHALLPLLDFLTLQDGSNI